MIETAEFKELKNIQDLPRNDNRDILTICGFMPGEADGEERLKRHLEYERARGAYLTGC